MQTLLTSNSEKQLDPQFHPFCIFLALVFARHIQFYKLYFKYIEKGREERKGHPFFFVKCVFPIKKNIGLYQLTKITFEIHWCQRDIYRFPNLNKVYFLEKKLDLILLFYFRIQCNFFSPKRDVFQALQGTLANFELASLFDMPLKTIK